MIKINFRKPRDPLEEDIARIQKPKREILDLLPWITVATGIAWIIYVLVKR